MGCREEDSQGREGWTHLRHLLAYEPRPGFLEGEMSNETKGCTPAYLTGPCSWLPGRSIRGGLDI